MNQTKKSVILPVQEPGASMIASKEKKYEFRKGMPKGGPETEIIIVATGKAPSPRRVVAVAYYTGAFRGNPVFGITPEETLTKGGYDFKGDTVAIGLKVIDSHPLVGKTLEELGIKRTPQKYQYLIEEQE